MPRSNFVYESGEGVLVGGHGQHDFVYASGDPVNDSGQSSLVHESGTGLGGGPVVMEGVTVGYWETNETTQEFYNFKNQHKSDPSSTYHAAGLHDFGIKDAGGYRIYFIVHHSTASDEWSLGCWTPGPSGDGNEEGLDFIFHDFGDHAKSPGDPIVEDDSGTTDHNGYSTNANGDPVASLIWSWDPADGVMYQFTPGSFSVTVEIVEESLARGVSPRREPDAIRGRGPDDNVEKSWGGYGTTLQIDINV